MDIPWISNLNGRRGVDHDIPRIANNLKYMHWHSVAWYIHLRLHSCRRTMSYVRRTVTTSYNTDVKLYTMSYVVHVRLAGGHPTSYTQDVVRRHGHCARTTLASYYIWKPDPLDDSENPIFVYTLIYSRWCHERLGGVLCVFN
jgi:hypothetical protein